MGAPNGKNVPDSSSSQLHVLIAGAGIVGLTIAQGCLQNNIPFTIFERDAFPEERAQGWALTLHWCLDSLERTIGPALTKALPTAVVDPTLSLDKGAFLFFNGSTAEVRYRIPPTKRRLRLHRQRLRDVLATGLDIQYGKEIDSFEKTVDGRVCVRFKDGSVTEGSMLIGADGNHSMVRKTLNGAPLERLPINLIGVVRHFTPEQAAPLRALDPLLFHGLDPASGNYMWYSIQHVYTEADGRNSFDALVIISWKTADGEENAIPANDGDRIAMMKKRASGFAEPLRSIVMDIPDDLGATTRLSLGDYPCHHWQNQGIATLAGDAAHAMTMYRGEGANHGVLDSALIVDELKKVHSGQKTQQDAIDTYEDELFRRGPEAVLKSRRACLDAHVWEKITDDSPFIGARTPPNSAFRTN